MKKFIMIATMALSSMAFAQKANEVNVSLGFQSGAVHVGGTYEKDTGNVGWGGYFHLQTEKDDAADPVFQTMALGGMMKLHVVKNTTFDTYIAPGFGIAMISDIPQGNGEEDDKTVFGPSMKIGGQYYFNPDVKIGLEHFIITNWFDDEAPNSADFTNVVVGFEF